ncbi:MAG: 3-carboxy-cis,cis-muconate cycloisomerase [Frankia sp.]
MSGLWDPIFGTTAVASTTDDRAWMTALCDVEAALARAGAAVGLLDSATAKQIGAACADAAISDPAALGRRAAADGNPVIPLVRDLRAAVTRATGDDRFAAGVHLGATSQDILDTAAMLVARRATAVIGRALHGSADACARFAREHRNTPMAGRTLLRQALPTTFGAVAAGWGEGLDRAGARLSAVRSELAVQLGGAAGTLAALHPHGPAVRAALAGELGLADPGTVWHTERTRVADLAGALGGAAGAVGKIATDVVLLAQTELGEVREGAAGGSSSMPHKQNPIAAVTARAAAAQAPGLVATLLAAMPAEFQRGAGPWHAEWVPLTGLLNTTGGAATRLGDSLRDLRVDAEAMARNLRLLGEQVRPGQDVGHPDVGHPDVGHPDVGHAHDLVDHYLAGRRR